LCHPWYASTLNACGASLMRNEVAFAALAAASTHVEFAGHSRAPHTTPFG
jgi:hypothetical protein